ncbi:MAG: GNAT family N-acetyltransferase [Fimbriimonas ginsengisoli]|uniref:GNAT family N-acetyltransferase n=1 Tax=Fimbriimonas ginsengisoli TaxID=1005039 RepID=A0A931PUK5_FIMGI|nr:GNAT family N-acetyltransferase [Fimbriimonas ginsengisoli]
MLKGKKINLRTVRRKDLEAYLELASGVQSRGPHFPLNLPTETSLQTRFEKDGFWSDESGSLLIVDPETDAILGLVVHFKPVHYYDAVEIGYIVFDPGRRGKGVMTEALAQFTRYLFDLKPIHRIQAQIEPSNVASRRVAEKCGFRYEGTMRQAIISRGEPCDLDVFSILRSELGAEGSEG